MKHLLCLGIAGACLFGAGMSAEQTAQARLFCFSLRFQPGTSAGRTSTLALTTERFADPPNGELVVSSFEFSHESGFLLDEGLGLDPLPGTLAVNLPEFIDANENGFMDFFEVSQAVSGPASGIFNSAVGGGTVTAVWSREAGSKEGTCVFSLVSDDFGPLGSFTHVFELIEYAGTFVYTPGAGRVSGRLALAQTGADTNRLDGVIEFSKPAAHSLDTLELLPGQLANASSQALVYFGDLFDRFETNYFGYFEFKDGDLTSPPEDYYSWGLSIDDLNDTDGDGVPDLSDDFPDTEVRPPTLQISRGEAGLVLSLSGTLGRTHEIQTSVSLSTTNWTPFQSVLLTNEVQSISLNGLVDGPRFFRAAGF